MSLSDDATSPTLLLAIRNGDDAAWQRLVRIYGPLIFGWCRRVGLQESDALDVSQDTLMGVNKSLDRFVGGKAPGLFRGWLWALTKNKIADHRRKSYRQTSGGGGTEALQQLQQLPDDSPDSDTDIADLHLRILEELKLEFNETTWTAFWRVSVEGDAAKDVAADMGTTVWAVYKAKSRILSRLKEHFGEEFLSEENEKDSDAVS